MVPHFSIRYTYLHRVPDQICTCSVRRTSPYMLAPYSGHFRVTAGLSGLQKMNAHGAVPGYPLNEDSSTGSYLVHVSQFHKHNFYTQLLRDFKLKNCRTLSVFYIFSRCAFSTRIPYRCMPCCKPPYLHPSP